MSVTKKQQLELTWIGKENRPRLEPRILLDDPEKASRPPESRLSPLHRQQITAV